MHAAQVPVGASRESLHEAVKILSFGPSQRGSTTQRMQPSERDATSPPAMVYSHRATRTHPCRTLFSQLQTPAAIPGAYGSLTPVVENTTVQLDRTQREHEVVKKVTTH